ncbi:unnamed protein product [Pipistrellus nathusii]|uniref:Dexamethasone-induced Ras-related protein 1 n=1 Tax=Pipistrellus nathusii TaxID=59473 RepID=A0ABN9ZGZ5_PIPNA
MTLPATIKKMRPSRAEPSVPARNRSRLVILGSSKVGKTAIVSRFLTGRFEDAYTPTVEDFHRKFYSIRGQLYQLDILDTAGRQPFPAMRRLSILTGDVFILVFSLDNRESFEEAQRLRQQILDTKSCLRSKPGGRRDVPLVLCGNKGDRDLHREVQPAEVRRLLGAGPARCAYFEVSAKRNSSLEPMFRALFAMAGLPGEMSPGLHRRLSAPHGEALHQALRAGRQPRAGPGGALGVVAPFARRPSVHSDLLCVRAQAGGRAKHRERCVIS